MDFADLDLAKTADSGADMHVRHPVTEEPLTTDGKPITIRLLGADSAEFRNGVKAIANRSQSRKKPSLAEAERNAVELLARITTGWQGIVWNGEPLKFSRENAEMLYRERPWLREQADEFAGERANFFKTA